MKITFVCTGNTCRSPMLSRMFDNYAQSLGRRDITSDSAGLVEGIRRVSDYTVEVLRDNGIICGEYFSKTMDKRLFEASDLIFTMEAFQKSELERSFGQNGKIVDLKVFTGCDVPDPWQSGKDAYENVYAIFALALDKIYRYVVSCQR